MPKLKLELKLTATTRGPKRTGTAALRPTLHQRLRFLRVTLLLILGTQRFTGAAFAQSADSVAPDTARAAARESLGVYEKQIQSQEKQLQDLRGKVRDLRRRDQQLKKEEVGTLSQLKILDQEVALQTE